MKGALLIFAAMVAIGIVLYVADVAYYRKRHRGGRPDGGADGDTDPVPDPGDNGAPAPADNGGICCGTHAVCEKTNLSPLTGEIVYFDDEELDRFKGRAEDEYTPEEVEEFRDVLLTLLPQDVAGWSRSIQVRGITLPAEIRDELLIIVSELRGI